MKLYDKFICSIEGNLQSEKEIFFANLLGNNILNGINIYMQIVNGPLRLTYKNKTFENEIEIKRKLTKLNIKINTKKYKITLSYPFLFAQNITFKNNPYNFNIRTDCFLLFTNEFYYLNTIKPVIINSPASIEHLFPNKTSNLQFIINNFEKIKKELCLINETVEHKKAQRNIDKIKRFLKKIKPEQFEETEHIKIYKNQNNNLYCILYFILTISSLCGGYICLFSKFINFIRLPIINCFIFLFSLFLYNFIIYCKKITNDNYFSFYLPNVFYENEQILLGKYYYEGGIINGLIHNYGFIYDKNDRLIFKLISKFGRIKNIKFYINYKLIFQQKKNISKYFFGEREITL